MILCSQVQEVEIIKGGNISWACSDNACIHASLKVSIGLHNLDVNFTFLKKSFDSYQYKIGTKYL